MITRYLLGYIVTGLAFALIDSVWLRTMYTRLYQPEIGEMLMRGVRMGPAIVFYLFYILGMMVFAVGPALASGNWRQAVLYGALFGFFTYMTYDLTNFATLKLWSVKVTVLDIIWGTLLTGSAAGVGAAVTNKVLGQ